MLKVNKIIFFGIVVLVLACVVILLFTGCIGNYQVVDTSFNFNRAIIRLPNGEVIEGKLESWRDYDDSDQLQVKINGVTYLVHANNCALISGKGG